MKFNKSEIMSNAWSDFKMMNKLGREYSFSQALKDSWAEYKEEHQEQKEVETSYITAEIAKAIKWAQSKNINIELSEKDAKAIVEISVSQYKTVFQAVAAVAKMNDRIQAAN